MLRMREEYAFVIDRQLKLLRYLDAALGRIEKQSFGVCICCKELIHRNGSKQYRTRNSVLDAKAVETDFQPGEERLSPGKRKYR